MCLSARAEQIQALQQVEERLQKELSQQTSAVSHASQQAATLRQDLVIAHAARSDADSRAAATTSELTQLKSSLEECQASILQQSASASAAESDLQQQLHVLLPVHSVCSLPSPTLGTLPDVPKLGKQSVILLNSLPLLLWHAYVLLDSIYTKLPLRCVLWCRTSTSGSAVHVEHSSHA